MLPASLRRSLQRQSASISSIPPPPPPPTCLACACRCGAPIPSPSSPSPVQRRHLRAPKAAPSTRRRQGREETRYMTPKAKEDLSKFKTLNYLNDDGTKIWRERIEQHFADENRKVRSIATADDFHGFSVGLFNLWWHTAPHATRVNQIEFARLMREFKLSEHDAMWFVRILLREKDENGPVIGRRLVVALSDWGSEEATIFLVSWALLQRKRRPRMLESAEVKPAMKHLSQIADQGRNPRAMVLEGRLALEAQGKEDRAIRMWTKAVPLTIAAHEEAERKVSEAKGKDHVEAHGLEQDPLQLSSPWVDLMMIHKARCERGIDEWALCQEAMRVGCEQDDATSHYYYATFTKRVGQTGEHRPTSVWLYHMTKAAASGHPKAMHDLGVFYADSGWKYVEDEPADELKPTPFDSHPAPISFHSVSSKLRTFFGIKPPGQANPKHNIFHFAAFPSTALQRRRLAAAWTRLATSYGYAPAYLTLARMAMEKTLWAQANAPKHALDMSRKRYGEVKEPSEPDPPNPDYSPEDAKSHLRQVFLAWYADRMIRAKVRDAERQARSKGEAAAAALDDATITDSLQDRLLQQWTWFPEVREMYEDQIGNVWEQAKAILDEHGWDLYDDRNGQLLYAAAAAAATTTTTASQKPKFGT